MRDSGPTGPADALDVYYLRKSVLAYLNGQENWKFVMGVIRESGFGKDKAREALNPLKGQGWKFRSQALFNWLEQH